jgi:hypothetical protein
VANFIGRGVNYGHQGQNHPYDLVGQVRRDFILMRSLGITDLRIAYPPFDSVTRPSSLVLVRMALAWGFNVTFGLTAGGGVVTATRWAVYKNYVVNVFAPWAQELNNPRLQLSLGNEEELHVDGTTIGLGTIINDVTGSFATAVKAIYTVGPISYETSDTFRIPYRDHGTLGALDFIGFNMYREVNPDISVRIAATNMMIWFGSKAYISEYSTPNGYNDVSSESVWADNMATRAAIYQSVGVERFYPFCFRDGGFGMSQNKFGLMTSAGPRVALASLGSKTIITFH